MPALIPNYADGRRRSPAATSVIEVTSQLDGSVIGHFAATSSTELDVMAKESIRNQKFLDRLLKSAREFEFPALDSFNRHCRNLQLNQS